MMSEFREWMKVAHHARYKNYHSAYLCAQEAWEYQQEKVARLEALYDTLLEDVRGACGCTAGDDIRNHLAEYLED